MNSFITIITLFFTVVCISSAAPQGGSTTTAPVSLVNESSIIQPDGSFQYTFQESDGTQVQDVGTLKQIQVPTANGTGTEQVQVLVQTGSFSYPSPDGQQIQLNYTADETGFHPQGAHLPVAPIDLNNHQ